MPRLLGYIYRLATTLGGRDMTTGRGATHTGDNHTPAKQDEEVPRSKGRKSTSAALYKRCVMALEWSLKAQTALDYMLIFTDFFWNPLLVCLHGPYPPTTLVVVVEESERGG